MSSEFENSLNKYLKTLKSEISSTGFLDATSILENHPKYREGLLKLHSFDENSKYRRIATDKFVNYTSRLSDFSFSSGIHIRDFKLSKFPVYWVTDISEKHPLHHILFNVFYFNELFNIISQKTNCKKIIFLLPPDRFFYTKSVELYFKNRYKETSFECVSETTYLPSFRQSTSFARQNFKEHSVFLKELRSKKFEKIKEIKSKNIILTYLGSTWIPNQKVDFVLDGINSVLDSKAVYIPLIYDWKNIKNWSEPWDEKYLKAMPGKTEWLFFLMKYLSVARKITKLTDNHQLINDGPVSQYTLKLELLHALEYKYFMFKNYLWLSNYFKSFNGSNIFYQDEFYSFGKLVSSAINKSGGNRSIGFQHGMIREDHTVYALSEVEVKGKDSIPSPNYFIVWGDYFQNLICKRAESIRNKIVVAANPNLFKRNGSEIEANESTAISYDLLWCPGIKGELADEFNIILEYFRTNKEKKLLVRMHPVHDLKLEITEAFKKVKFENFTFSKEAMLGKDLQKSEIILSPSASTVVLEALALKRKVVGFSMGGYTPIEIRNANYVLARTSDELTKAIEKDFAKTEMGVTEQNQDELLSRDFSKWQEILI